MASEDKIYLAEIADSASQDKYFPFYANVWGLKTDNDYTGISAPEFELENIGVFDNREIISYEVNRKQYFPVNSIKEVIDNEEAFYFNNKLLLIHYKDNLTPYHFNSSQMRIGRVLGFYNTPREISGIYRGVQYFPRLLSQNEIKSQKDDLFEQKQKFSNLKINIENADLRFKNFSIGNGVLPKIGNLVKLYSYAGDDASTATIEDFTLDYQGIVSKIIEGETIQIDIKDLRTSLTDKTPENILDNANFPSIKDGTYRKPKLWGQAKQIPCVCLNEEVNEDVDVLPPSSESATSYDFMICDISQRTIASDSIKAIYINNVKTNLSATVSYDTTNNIAYFTLDEGNFRETRTSGDGTSISSVDWKNQDKVTIDCNGYLDDSTLIENGLEIIRSIIFDVYDKPFTNTFYDLATWSSFEATAYDIAYYSEKPISVQKQIEEISSSQLGRFIYNQDLKFSFDNDDQTANQATITKDQFFPETYIPKFTIDPSQVLNTLRIGYNQRWSISDKELKHTWLTDTSNSDNAINKYGAYTQKDFPTLISNLTDAQDFSTRILFESGDSINTFTIDTLWDYRQLKAGDFVRVQADLQNDIYLGWVTCQVQEVKPKVTDWSVMIKLRVFEYG